MVLPRDLPLTVAGALGGKSIGATAFSRPDAFVLSCNRPSRSRRAKERVHPALSPRATVPPPDFPPHRGPVLEPEAIGLRDGGQAFAPAFRVRGVAPTRHCAVGGKHDVLATALTDLLPFQPPTQHVGPSLNVRVILSAIYAIVKEKLQF